VRGHVGRWHRADDGAGRRGGEGAAVFFFFSLLDVDNEFEL